MKKPISIVFAALLASVSISAEGECKPDREKLCKAAQGNMKAMHDCMKSHEADLSPACKKHRAEILEKSKDIKSACKGDYKKLCKGVKAGDGRIIKCLKDNDAQLSAGCKSALANTNIEH